MGGGKGRGNIEGGGGEAQTTVPKATGMLCTTRGIEPIDIFLKTVNTVLLLLLSRFSCVRLCATP